MPQHVSPIVVRATDPPHISAPVTTAQLYDEVLKLRPRHHVNLGKRPLPCPHGLVMPPLPITAPDEPIGAPQPPPATAEATESKCTDEIGPDHAPKRHYHDKAEAPGSGPDLEMPLPTSTRS
ncbi:hypothetical protein ACIO87_03300 [Streptomyces sp. NPDC087218]|uniref:hypothetical protein n=1 Tax=Streptomyces sp. NPDC087218 TaxID=3365769 RepID=UPI00381B1D3E